jgi:hypothetical protein
MRNVKFQVLCGRQGTEWGKPTRFYWVRERAIIAIQRANRKGWDAVLLTLTKRDNETVLTQVTEYQSNN